MTAKLQSPLTPVEKFVRRVYERGAGAPTLVATTPAHQGKEATMTIRLTTLFITAALTLPAAAWSKPGDRDFGQTFPAASRLCQAVVDGHGPKRLHGHEADVTTACGALQSAYDTAVAAAPSTGPTSESYRDSAKAYHQSIRTARRAFWTTIKGLVGGSSAGVPNAAGTPDPTADTPDTA